ncbi:TraX family protein [Fenollaria sporofastidiosus]|uniref:TraX family protein n=1 Tax=Fenollaria sporofastidiosus TaxID=2811778 RepID=UPI001C0017CC|nr:TraX family protein [Fenollaria sporofastidiosus]
METETKLLEEKKVWGLNQTQLKFIAILSMLVDHLVYGIFEVGLYQNIINAANITIAGSYVTGAMMDKIHFIGRIVIGRIAFPLFCFFIVQGFIHTRNRMKYALRLFIFALISEVPFDLVSSNVVFDPNYQNVFFTLFLGLAALIIIEKFANQPLIRIAGVLLCIFAAKFLKTDYDMFGVILIVLMYFVRFNKFQNLLVGISTRYFYGFFYQMSAFVLMYFYNGERGKGFKYFFYAFYPVHLLLIYFLRMYIASNPIAIF